MVRWKHGKMEKSKTTEQCSLADCGQKRYLEGRGEVMRAREKQRDAHTESRTEAPIGSQ